MSIAIIHWKDGSMQRLSDDSKDAALEAYYGLRRRAPECVETIRKVSLPPSWYPAGTRPVRVSDEIDIADKLLHPGVPQGKAMAYGRDD